MAEAIKGGWSPNPEGDAALKAILPTLDGTSFLTMDAYVQALQMGYGEVDEDRLRLTAKALNVPPQTLSFLRASYMPDQTASGVLPWPGIQPEAIRKVVMENVAPQLIIGMRVDDVLRYSTFSSHPWRPGWQIELMESKRHPSEPELREMREAEKFLFNSNIETSYAQARTRDKKKLTDFQRFLAALTRDTLTFDGMAIWTDMDNAGRVKGYALLPAGNIRMAPKGYQDRPDAFAVAVDEASKVLQPFNRDELVWYVRNPRTDPLIGGYGYPEIEIGMRLIMGFQNALDLNIDVFSRGSIPHGIMLLKGGGWVQKQIDALARMWANLKKGITKSWALPVIATPKDGDVTILNLQDLKGTDVRYQDFTNMVAGCFCTVFRFPVRRLGYRISGKGPDTAPLPDSAMKLVDEDDPGLAPLLIHIENVINEYLIWSRWPHLRFVFNGKNPKEDARAYEAKRNALTWGEARAEADLRPLKHLVPPPLKDLAELFGLFPIDPNLAGQSQSVLAAYIKGYAREGDERDAEHIGSPMQSKKDPAQSEQHGHMSGVRRDSATEKRNNGAGA